MTKILVIEDTILLNEDIVEWLTFEGYDVVSAVDGMAGLKMALSDLPDVIICDLRMPLLDGYQVLAGVRAHPVTVHLPFIFLTSSASVENIRAGLAAGADFYVTKPFTQHELLDTIRDCLQKKQGERHDDPSLGV